MGSRCCSRCGAVVLERGATLKPEQGELRRFLPTRVLLLCVGCQEAFLDWLREPHEVADALYHGPARASV